MGYTVEKAAVRDLSRILEIYANARVFMARTGNPTQWGDGYPKEELLQEDICGEKLYVIRDGERIRGVFYLDICQDPTYAVIYEGRWHSDEPYGVIHRIAGDGGGILRTAVEFALGRIRHLRIDTHADNTVMQGAVAKLGFRYCGIIYVEDGTPRFAYDLIQ